MKRRNLVIAVLILAVPVVIFGAYVLINFIVPSIVTEVAVTGVPTARSNSMDTLRTQQFETRQARTLTPTLAGKAPAANDGVVLARYVDSSSRTAFDQTGPLYTPCISVRGATATPAGQAMATPEATPEATMEPTPAATPAGEADFAFFSIVKEESEACYQVGEILRGAYVLVVGVTKSIGGEVAIDRNNVANSRLGDEVVVNLAELRTDQPNRDRWMISDRGFNFNAFPFARLVEAKLVGLPTAPVEAGKVYTFRIEGKLEIKEQKYDVTFNMTGVLNADTLVISGYYDTRLTDIGLFPPDLGFVKVNEQVRIVLNLVARPS